MALWMMPSRTAGQAAEAAAAAAAAGMAGAMRWKAWHIPQLETTFSASGLLPP
jgi:hypothetical protein